MFWSRKVGMNTVERDIYVRFLLLVFLRVKNKHERAPRMCSRRNSAATTLSLYTRWH